MLKRVKPLAWTVHREKRRKLGRRNFCLHLQDLRIHDNEFYGKHFITNRRFQFGEKLLVETTDYWSQKDWKEFCALCPDNPHPAHIPCKAKVSAKISKRSNSILEMGKELYGRKHMPFTAAMVKFILTAEKASLRDFSTLGGMVGSEAHSEVTPDVRHTGIVRAIAQKLPTYFRLKWNSTKLSELALLYRLNTYLIRHSFKGFTAVFNSPTFLSHHCRPQVTAFVKFAEHRRAKLELICTDPEGIPAESEVFASFVDPLLPKHIRKKLLKKRFGYDCQCLLCRSEDLSRAFKCKGCGKGIILPSYTTEWWQCSDCHYHFSIKEASGCIKEEKHFSRFLAPKPFEDLPSTFEPLDSDAHIHLRDVLGTWRMHRRHYLMTQGAYRQFRSIHQHQDTANYALALELADVVLDGLRRHGSEYYSETGLQMHLDKGSILKQLGYTTLAQNCLNDARVMSNFLEIPFLAEDLSSTFQVEKRSFAF